MENKGLKLKTLKKMRIPHTELAEKDVVQVRRVRVARGRKSKLEVVVKFCDVETRDHVASYAYNLGEFIQNGKPTATFRHEIPTFLSGVHKTFVQYGFAMASKHGREFKRNVRFDNIMHSFCMDVKMPGSTKWITVSHDRALADLQESRRAAEEKSKEQLSSLGSGLEQPEQGQGQDEAALGASGSGAPVPTGGARLSRGGAETGGGTWGSNL